MSAYRNGYRRGTSDGTLILAAERGPRSLSGISLPVPAGSREARDYLRGYAAGLVYATWKVIPSMADVRQEILDSADDAVARIERRAGGGS